jgi:DNA-binding response OmpR family regulator
MDKGTLDRPVLIVEDDEKIMRLVRVYLEREGFAVIGVPDGLAALAAIRAQAPCLIVLDRMLPGLDGDAVLRRVREESETPVLIISARGSVADRVYGIDEGADDYLPKPFSPAELVSRVKAILRRVRRPLPERSLLRCADLVIELARREVRRADQPIALTGGEFRLLVALVEADGRVLTRDELLDALYRDHAADALDRTVDVYVRRLRTKLGDDPERPKYISTVRGAGYRALGVP